MPSSRLVFPSPFGPTATISPSGTGSIRVYAWLRKSRSSTQTRRIRGSLAPQAFLAHRRGQADRHHQVRELVALAVDHTRLQPVAHVQPHGLARGGVETVCQILRVERDRQILALVPSLDRLDRLAEIG